MQLLCAGARQTHAETVALGHAMLVFCWFTKLVYHQWQGTTQHRRLLEETEQLLVEITPEGAGSGFAHTWRATGHTPTVLWLLYTMVMMSPCAWQGIKWRDARRSDTSGAGVKALASAAVAEFFCTAAFLFLATGAVTSGCHTADTAARSGANSTLATVPPGACFLGSTNLLNIALAFGLAIFILVYASASFSGGHLNPAVTFAMLLAGRVSILRAVVYLISQLAGAMVGSALVLAIDPLGYRAALGAANRLNTWATAGTAFGAEVLLTAIFIFIVFSAVDQARGAISAHLPVLAPFAIGIAVFMAHIIAVPIDGCSINPARSFGTAVVANVWEDHWIFWIGPLIGAGVTGLAYENLAYRGGVLSGPREGIMRPEIAKQETPEPAGPQEYTV